MPPGADLVKRCRTADAAAASSAPTGVPFAADRQNFTSIFAELYRQMTHAEKPYDRFTGAMMCV
jgi:hypothetical protein